MIQDIRGRKTMNLRKPLRLILLIVLVPAAWGSASGDSGLKAGKTDMML